MKKNIIKEICIVSLFILTLNSLFAQKPTPYSDAVAIKSFIENGNNTNIFEIMKKYFPGKTIATTDQLKELVQNNNYLKDVFKTLNTNKDTGNKDLSLNSHNGLQGGLSISPTSFANTLAGFIADRMKQEIDAQFLDKLKEFLKNNAEILSLMPKTYSVLLNNDPYNYTAFFESLKEAFNNDIQNLTSNIKPYLQKLGKTCKDATPTSKDIQDVENTGFIVLSTFDTIKGGIKPSVALSIIDNYPEINSINNTDLKNSFILISILDRAFLGTGSDWVTPTNFKTFVFTPEQIGAKLFLGLLELQLNGILIDKKDLGAELDKLNTDVNEVLNSAYNLVDNYSILKSEYDFFNSNKDKISPANLFKTISNFLLNSISKINVLGNNNSIDQNSKFTNFLSELQSLSNIAQEIQTKEYGLAYAEVINFIYNKLPNDDTHKKAKANALKYGNFVITVITATSSDGMTKALDNAALPVGSYRIKRSNQFDISINSYGGAMYNTCKFEMVNSTTNQNLGVASPFGLTGSIGLCFSGSIPTCDKTSGWSFSAYLSLIDVGGLLQLHLADDSVSNLPQLTWGNILAPGGFLVIGIPNSPISLGAGYQYGPQLWGTKDNAYIFVNKSFAFKAFIAVDIPVFQLYTHTRSD